MTNDSTNTLSDRLSTLGAVPPDGLTGARLVLHWAAQTVASFGFSMLPARDDFSHTSLRWSDEAQALCSQVHDGTGLHAALHPVDLALLLRRGHDELERLSLEGRTLDDTYTWLAEALGRAGQSLPDGIVRPGHLGEMPAHPVGEGSPIVAPDPAHCRELAGWFATADALLRELRAEVPEVGEIRCWPHHFDTAVLHVLAGEGESMQSVGVGLSPGDSTYDEPYVYVTPWPYPTGELLELSSGHWHTEGWTGAVLRGSEILQPSGAERATASMKMIRMAYRFCAEKLSEQGS